MSNVALISAAGWKGAGCRRGLVNCPEALLPLGNGTTPLSRLVTQFKTFGFTILIGVGKPGCLYPKAAAFALKNKGNGFTPDAAEFGRTVSPWKQENIDHIASLGKPILIEEPDEGDPHETFCFLIDDAGLGWDEICLVHGDTLLSDKLFQHIMTLPCPCQIRLHGRSGHTILRLDRRTGKLYRTLAEPHRIGRAGFAWWCHHGFDLLCQEGVHQYNIEDDYRWCDIDYPTSYPVNDSSYERALAWVTEHPVSGSTR